MNKFISAAIKQAQKAYTAGEIPVGAVVVKDGKIISRGYNKRESSQIATKHAEIIAIEKACKKLGSWRLEDCDIYVSLEPCPMCLGACVNARLKNIYYAAEQTSSSDNITSLIASSNRLNHKVNLILIKDERASALLSQFFAQKRRAN